MLLKAKDEDLRQVQSEFDAVMSERQVRKTENTFLNAQPNKRFKFMTIISII